MPVMRRAIKNRTIVGQDDVLGLFRKIVLGGHDRGNLFVSQNGRSYAIDDFDFETQKNEIIVHNDLCLFNGSISVRFKSHHSTLIFHSFHQNNRIPLNSKVFKLPRNMFKKRKPKQGYSISLTTAGGLSKTYTGQMVDISANGIGVLVKLKYDALPMGVEYVIGIRKTSDRDILFNIEGVPVRFADLDGVSQLASFRFHRLEESESGIKKMFDIHKVFRP